MGGAGLEAAQVALGNDYFVLVLVRYLRSCNFSVEIGHPLPMTRLIIPALVALLVSGPAWGETV